ncbi:JAB domain-containing protein [Chitinophaga silvatica]|uniref:JAB domain-containing protein n=1 Tax=Chitinophaga silvatica TaxID=2282649 RepID=A0A3E1Y8A5_9BACT|nr:DNA repair protein RadC [Chitinophaga silvatica]RFS21405.1 JAB domain-containing protein [Chitinophaga silvatica]
MFVNVYPTSHLPISSWAEDDKPREKLINIGASSLSDAELLAILIQTGHKQKTALDLAKEILQLAHNNLSELGKISASQLSSLRGIGEAKAITILAAMELARRRQAGYIHKKTVISSGAAAALFLKPILADYPYEIFYVLFLNHANKVLAHKRVSNGGISSTVVDGRLIFKEAIINNATKILLCHNHPSGNLKPSQSDILVTRRMKEMGQIFDILLIDHIIVGETGYLSLAEEGML